MDYPAVLVMESSNQVAHLLRSRCPDRTWVVAQAQTIAEVQDALPPARFAVLIVDVHRRFAEALAWVLEHRPAANVIALIANRGAGLHALLSDLGVRYTLNRDDIFDHLPDLVAHVSRAAAKPAEEVRP
jgi:hypothetical protein